MKKTSMLTPVRNLWYIKCYSSGSPDLLKALSILSDTTVRRSAVYQENLKPYPKSEKKKDQTSLGDQQAYYLQVLQRLYWSQKDNNNVVVFSSRPFPNTLKYRDH